MLQSMTGFARSQGTLACGDWTCEARSVNSKGLDIRLNLPVFLAMHDAEIRKDVKQRFKRGSVTVSFQLNRTSDETDLVVNRGLLSRLARLDRAYGNRPRNSAGTIAPYLAVKGVISGEKPRNGGDLSADETNACRAAICETLDALQNARRGEGEKVTAMLESLVEDMAKTISEAQALASDQSQMLFDRLSGRVRELTSDTEIDQQRLAQEVALLASKADVREEIDRLLAHTEDARSRFATSEPQGRKLEFLSQEFNREANTLGAKSASLELTRCSLALKSSIDQFREQAANVE